jgi:hypothetical protein
MGRIVLARSMAPVTLVVAMSVSIVLALAGPFGTYHEMPLPQRLGYWGLIVLTSIPLGHGTRLVAADWAPGSSVAGQLILPSALMVALYTPVLFVIVRYVGEAHGSALDIYLWLAGLVAVVAVCINAVRWALGLNASAGVARPEPNRAEIGPAVEAPDAATRSPSADTFPVVAMDAAPPPRIASRLGDLPCTEVLRLTARDHYVDVVTRRASKALLLRLSDAMAEVEGIPGAQVHRSHWVARAAVVKARRDGGRIVLVLADGSVVPVSRGYRDRAEAAGLLTGLDRPALAAAE